MESDEEEEVAVIPRAKPVRATAAKKFVIDIDEDASDVADDASQNESDFDDIESDEDAGDYEPTPKKPAKGKTAPVKSVVLAKPTLVTTTTTTAPVKAPVKSAPKKGKIMSDDDADSDDDFVAAPKKTIKAKPTARLNDDSDEEVVRKPKKTKIYTSPKKAAATKPASPKVKKTVSATTKSTTAPKSVVVPKAVAAPKAKKAKKVESDEESEVEIIPGVW